MAKVLSIEVGYSLTKVCEVDFKTKNPKVYSSFTIQTPENIMEDGLIRVPDSLAESLRQELDKNGIKTKQVVYTIASSKIASREAMLPFVKENKLEEVVCASAGDYFPVDLTNFKITYQITDIVTTTDNVKQYKLMLFVAPNELLESYYALSEKAGLSVVALDYSGNSLCAAVKDVLTTGTQMVIKVDENSSILTVFSDGIMRLQRTVPYGGDTAVEAVMEAGGDSGKIGYKEALELLRSRTCLNPTLKEVMNVEVADTAEDKVKVFRSHVTESVSMLVNGILRVVDYYNSRNSDKPLEQVYLTGYAEYFNGLAELMSNEIGLSINKLSELQELTFMQGLNNGGEYISCIGAAIAPMDFIPDVHNDKKKKALAKKKDTGDSKVSGESYRLVILVSAGCAIIAIVLAVISIIPYMDAKRQNEQLHAQEEKLAPIEITYAEYTNLAALNTDIQIMYAATERPNDRLVEFLEELQLKLPYGTNVLSFSSGDWDVTMTMNVESMEAAALTVLELRNFNSIETANIASVTQELDEESGAIKVTFTVDCTYAPLTYEINGEAYQQVEMIPGE